LYETPGELDELQALIDRSFAGAGPHLLAIMIPERRLTARQVVRYMDGIKHISLGRSPLAGSRASHRSTATWCTDDSLRRPAAARSGSATCAPDRT
jgi:hypothetical protein